ncbi:MAG: FMN-binding protein [Desulfobacterales bacterium]|nr:FMN-binding protein [Desulfobacterales bacterium]
MSDRLRSLLFAAVIALVCGLLLTAGANGLKERQGKNIAMDRQKNILKSVGMVQEGAAYSHEEIGELFSQNIKRIQVDSRGNILGKGEAGDKAGGKALPIYVLLKDNRIESCILPVDVKGLWGRIMGYLALKNDGSTIAGFTVYKHSETPGLGGEIEKRWFGKNFEGKKIVDGAGDFVSIAIAKGSVADVIPEALRPNHVDGISGATLTGKFLTEGLKETLLEYEPVSLNLRADKLFRMPDSRKAPENKK